MIYFYKIKFKEKEYSPYYSEEIIDNEEASKVKSKYDSDMIDALKTIKAISFFNTGNEYDEENLTRPSRHLQVALREKFEGGSSSAPLFQVHTNTLTNSIHAGFFISTFFTAGATAPYHVAYAAFLGSLPDILLSGGNLKKDPKTELPKADWTNPTKINAFGITTYSPIKQIDVQSI